MMMNPKQDHVPSDDVNDIILWVHPVLRAWTKDPDSVVTPDPASFTGARLGDVITTILTRQGSKDLKAVPSTFMMEVLNALAEEATFHVPTGVDMTAPALEAVAFSYKKAVSRPKLQAHLNAWAEVLGLLSVDELGVIGDEAGPYPVKAMVSALCAKVREHLDEFANRITQQGHLHYIANAVAKALTPTATYDHEIVKHVAHFEAHVFQRDEQETPLSRTRMADVLVRAVALYAEEEAISNFPSKDQVTEWSENWRSSDALEKLQPLHDEDGCVDVAKIHSVYRALLLLQTVSPPSSPETRSVDEQRNASPVTLDPFNSPPRIRQQVTPTVSLAGVTSPAPSDVDPRQPSSPLSSYPGPSAMVAALKCVERSDLTQFHIETLTAYPTSKLAFHAAQLFCFTQKLSSDINVAREVNEVMVDLASCSHDSAVQNSAALVSALGPGTIYHGYLSLHKQRVLDHDANKRAAEQRLADDAAKEAVALAAKDADSKKACGNPACNHLRCISESGGKVLVRIDMNGTPTCYHDFCCSGCRIEHQVAIQVQRQLKELDTRSSPSNVDRIPVTPHRTVPAYGLQHPRHTPELAAQAQSLTPWLGMVGLFTLANGTDVAAKLVSSDQDAEGPLATFQTIDGSALLGVRLARAVKSFQRLRSALATPDSVEGDEEMVRYFDSAVKDMPAYANASGIVANRGPPANSLLQAVHSSRVQNPINHHHHTHSAQRLDFGLEPIRDRVDWAPTKEQVVDDAKDGYLHVQNPLAKAKSIADIFAWKSAAGLSNFVNAYSSNPEVRQSLVDLMDADLQSDLAATNSELGANPREKDIWDLVFALNLPSLHHFNKARNTSSFLDAPDELELKVQDGRLKNVGSKTKYNKVSTFDDLLFSVATIQRILATFYNTAIVLRRFAEIVAEMREIFRKTQSVKVVAKYLQCVFKSMRTNRNEVIRTAKADKAHVGSRLADDKLCPWSQPLEWLRMVKDGHVQMIVQQNQQALIAQQQTVNASNAQQLAELHRQFKQIQGSQAKQPKQNKQAKRPNSPHPTPKAAPSAKRAKTDSPQAQSFMSSFGKILITKDAFSALLSSKLGVDTSMNNPNVWLAKAKDAWISDAANQGKCFAHHFLRDNNAIGACKFGPKCRAESHG